MLGLVVWEGCIGIGVQRRLYNIAAASLGIICGLEPIRRLHIDPDSTLYVSALS
jgi:hypothetical protein